MAIISSSEVKKMRFRIQQPSFAFTLVAILLASQLVAAIPDVCCCATGASRCLELASPSCCGSEVATTQVNESSCCCHPGAEQAVALADVLVGDKNPCGCDADHQHLPATSRDQQEHSVATYYHVAQYEPFVKTNRRVCLLDRPPPSLSLQVLHCIWLT